ncbi:MAG: YraN family protein [Saprospiraceae bacterium]|nr:YraN family protein [Saprospiraceae bacterium]
MAEHNEIGQRGEDIAADYLTQKNYTILDRNWRCGRAEIDVVAMHGTILVFAEVKTRSNDLFQRPESAVNEKKRRLLARAAVAYMRKIGHEWAIRFDIIAIVKHDTQFFVDHFEDAFFPRLAD